MSSAPPDALAAETITLHTAPWTPDHGRSTSGHYQSVQKITASEGIELDRSSGVYVFDNLDEVDLALPSELKHRLLSFFDTYFVRGGRFYNCHRFALHMSGVELPADSDDSDLFEMIQPMVDEGSLHEGPLELGRMGVIGHKRGSRPTPLHSVIGLGESSRQCLQVRGIGGELAIDSYDNTLTAYGSDSGIPYPEFGMYVRKEKS